MEMAGTKFISRGAQTASVQGPSPAKIVGQIEGSHTVEAFHPAAKAAVVSIDVLDVEGAPDPDTGLEGHRLVGDALLLGEIVITGIAVADEQTIPIQHGGQALMELRFADGASPGHKIQRLSGAITGNQNAHLLLRRSALFRGLTPLSGWSGKLTGALHGLKHVSLIRLRDALHVTRPVLLHPVQEAVPPAKAGRAVHGHLAGSRPHGQGVQNGFQIGQPL
jgi:hypothetical protein